MENVVLIVPFEATAVRDLNLSSTCNTQSELTFYTSQGQREIVVGIGVGPCAGWYLIEGHPDFGIYEGLRGWVLKDAFELEADPTLLYTQVTTPSPTGTVTPISVAPRDQGDVFSLKTGDCFNSMTLDSNTVSSGIDMVSCDDPHTSEVYAMFELPDSVWKGQVYVREQADIGCTARSEPFVGIEYDLSIWYMQIFYPTYSSWQVEDDRVVHCNIITESGTKVTGSAKGSRP